MNQDTIAQKLIRLYGEKKGNETAKQLFKIVEAKRPNISGKGKSFWDEKDIFLLTYPDSFIEENVPSLKTLAKFLDLHIKGVIDSVHILPFFPYSSDRGFSVIDYYHVKRDWGNWGDLGEIGKRYRLMADLVLNHISAKHQWFKRFLEGDKKYEGYFIWFKKDEIPHEDLKKVFRPRATPLLTPFKTARGERCVWTTYSKDQIDLNYKNPGVLLEVIKIMLNLLKNNARIIRLDVASLLWKEIGTSCRHLPQVHTIISLLRDILNIVCPQAFLVSEVNAPVQESALYFGEDGNETQIVYNFSLPPLVFQAFLTGFAERLTNWAKKLPRLSEKTTLMNILDTHDGIKLQAVKSILNDEEIQNLVTRVEDNGGTILYSTDSLGQKSVYEICSTWWSALNKKDGESFELQLQKFITSRAIALSLAGIPAIYYLSLFGGENDVNLWKKTGVSHDTNRTNLSYPSLTAKLSDTKSKEAKVFQSILSLVEKRKSFPAFHPNAKQEILDLDQRVFAILRGGESDQVLALHNLSRDRLEVIYKSKAFILEPYRYLWVKIG